MLTGMKQSSLDLNLSTKKTRKQELLAQMDRVVPWAALVEVIAPYYPEGKNGRPPFALETMLRIHCMQQWFTLSDLAMEEAFFDTPIYREFAGLDAHGRMPDESTILRFRHRLEKHKLAEQILATVNELLAAQGLLLKAGTAVDATLIAAPSSTKNKDRKRDPEMHSSQKGNEPHRIHPDGPQHPRLCTQSAGRQRQHRSGGPGHRLRQHVATAPGGYPAHGPAATHRRPPRCACARHRQPVQRSQLPPFVRRPARTAGG